MFNLIKQFKLVVMYLVSIVAVVDACTIPFRQSFDGLELFGIAIVIVILLLRDYKYNS